MCCSPLSLETSTRIYRPGNFMHARRQLDCQTPEVNAVASFSEPQRGSVAHDDQSCEGSITRRELRVGLPQPARCSC